MRTPILLACAFSLAFAQQTRHEVTDPPSEASHRPNNPQVPEGYATSSQFERVVIFRFKFQTDLLAGLNTMMKQNHIQNAVILAGAGSVISYQMHQVSNREFPSKDMFEQDPTAAADLVSMNGYVIKGRIHAHMTLANPEKAFGGHLEPGTRVFTFAIVTVGVLPDSLDLSKLDDKSYR